MRARRMIAMAWAGVLATAGGCRDDAVTPSGDDTTGAPASSTGMVPPADTSVDDTGTPGSTSTGEPTASSSDGASGADTGIATIGVDLCGDGRIDDGEECDDGNRDGGDTCSAECTLLVEVAWTDIHAGPGQGYDEANAVVVDIDDSIWVLGSESATIGGNLWLRHYAADGAPQETFAWSGPGGIAAAGYDLQWTASGDLAIAGIASSNPTGADILVAVFDPTAQDFVWTQVIDGPGSGAGALDSDGAFAIGITPSGDLVVAGAVAVDGQGRDIWVAAFDPAGLPLWEQTWSGAGETNDTGFALIVADDGHTSVLGVTVEDAMAMPRVLRFDPDGNPTEMPMPDFGASWLGLDMSAAQDADLLVGGYSAAGSKIWRASADWMPLEQLDLPMFTFAHALSVGGGRIHAAGRLSTPGAPDAWLGALDEDGTLLWSDAYDHPEGHDQDGWTDVTVDSAGDVIVVGTTQPVEDGDYDIIVRKYHPL
jgi:cysteine-rich repeat protein